MPTIVSGSISILSDAGLGMAMFSLGISFFFLIFLIFLERGGYLIHVNFLGGLNRFVHGFTTKDDSLWENRGCILNGCQILDRPSRDCRHLHCHRYSRSSSTCCHCSGKALVSRAIYIKLVIRLIIYLKICKTLNTHIYFS